MQHRLFIAIDLPDAVRGGLARLVADAPRGARSVRPEQLHLTLHFLGDVDEQAMAAVATSLGRLEHPAFEIDLGGLGVFPPRGRPNVIWVGVAPCEPLESLHAAVARVIVDCGFTPESRRWVPHVTIARLAPPGPQAWTTAMLDRHRDFAVPAVPIAAVRLYESLRLPDTVLHQPVTTVPLVAADGRSDG